MRSIIAVVSLFLFSSAALGQEVLRKVSWTAIGSEMQLQAGEVMEANDAVPFAHLKVQNETREPRTFRVLTISEPGIASSRYAVAGELRYEGVEGIGYLEMWSYFPDGGAYFSRTLSTSGPLGRLEGSSGWRSFSLPFNIGDGTVKRPVKLEVSVFLPKRGTVYLGPLEVVQYEEEGGPVPAGRRQAWWGARTGGMMGGAAGSIIGLMGGVIGVLGGLGKARRVVMFLLTLLSGVGVVCLALGLTAVLLSQPYGVYYPPLALGFTCAIVPTALRGTARRRFEAIELRRMKAMDVS